MDVLSIAIPIFAGVVACGQDVTAFRSWRDPFTHYITAGWVTRMFLHMVNTKVIGRRHDDGRFLATFGDVAALKVRKSKMELAGCAFRRRGGEHSAAREGGLQLQLGRPRFIHEPSLLRLFYFSPAKTGMRIEGVRRPPLAPKLRN